MIKGFSLGRVNMIYILVFIMSLLGFISKFRVCLWLFSIYDQYYRYYHVSNALVFIVMKKTFGFYA